MSNGISRLKREATCWRLVLLFIACVVCYCLFDVRGYFMWPSGEAPAGMKPPDLRRFGYSGAELHEYYTALDVSGRGWYAGTQLTLDVIFPFVYCALFVGLLARFFPRRLWWPWECPLDLPAFQTTSRRYRRWLWCVWVPAGVAVCDLCENLLVAVLAFAFPSPTRTPEWSAIAEVAACFTVAKSALIGVMLLLVVIALLFRILDWLKMRSL